MQKVSTIVFICASIAFGLIGITMMLFTQGPDGDETAFSGLLQKLLFTTVFVILPSFALSVAGKYLSR
jgi:hypothetical protein